MDLQTVETVAVEIAEAPNLTDTLLNIIPTIPWPPWQTAVESFSLRLVELSVR